MEKIMAAFGQGFVQAAVLSENNAVKYRFSIAGSCAKSTIRPYVKLQDEAFGSQDFAQGITVLEIEPRTRDTINTKNYIFEAEEDSAVNGAFITYMDSIPEDKLIIIISEGNFKTSDTLTKWFHEHGSAAWPTKWDLERFDMAYSAFYISGRNTITAEHVIYNDGVTVEPIEANLDLVFDYFQDIGATGFPRRTVEYDGEVEAGPGEVDIIRLPDADTIYVPLDDYGLAAGDTMYLKAQLYADSDLIATGTTRLSLRWLLDGNVVSTTNIDANLATPNVWQPFEREYEVPSGVNQFTLYVYKTEPDGIGKARNIVFNEMTRPETPVMRSAEFGVNGIRMNTMIDNNVTTDLLVLRDSKTDERGIVTSAEFREF